MKTRKTILSIVIAFFILSFCFVSALADTGYIYDAPEVLRDDGVWYIPENPAEVGFIFYCGTPVDHRVYSGILGGMVDTFASVISNNLNVVMKFLATVTIVMSIPTMIASFYGMNVPLPGQNNPYGFYIVLAFALLLAGLVALIFHKKDVF